MAADLNKVRQLHAWTKRLMSITGCWPLEPRTIKFYIGYLYLALHLTGAANDLFYVFGDINMMIGNLSESTVELMVFSYMSVLRHSAKLVKVVKEVQNGANDKNYRDEKEKYLYLEYTTIGRMFIKVFGCVVVVSEVTYYLGPLEGIVKAVVYRETIEYALPYRMRPFFNISNTPIYALVYLGQLPMFYFFCFHSISICFLVTLIVHVAGDMSILAYRIKNINNEDVLDDSDRIESAFRDITNKQMQLIETAQSIDGIFNLILMQELLGTTVLIGLTAYNCLLISDIMSSIFEFVTFLTFAISMVGVIFLYCLIGEFLMRESINVEQAYYECQWYTMPTKYKKHMIICMIRAQKSLQLTAGGFYVFSLTRFSDVLKTSMAYISMLRTVV